MNPSADDSGLEGGPFGTNEFSPQEMDELFDALANTQRRCALRTLYDAGGIVSFDDLVSDVARQTVTQPPDQSQRKQISTSLYHVHLPKLESVGLITEFDSEGEVRLADRIEDISPALFRGA